MDINKVRLIAEAWKAFPDRADYPNIDVQDPRGYLHHRYGISDPNVQNVWISGNDPSPGEPNEKFRSEIEDERWVLAHLKNSATELIHLLRKSDYLGVLQELSRKQDGFLSTLLDLGEMMDISWSEMQGVEVARVKLLEASRLWAEELRHPNAEIVWRPHQTISYPLTYGNWERFFQVKELVDDLGTVMGNTSQEYQQFHRIFFTIVDRVQQLMHAFQAVVNDPKRNMNPMLGRHIGAAEEALR